MELGLTIPLQRHLRCKPPLYGTEPDLRFCWDLHVIRLRGSSSLLAVHCFSRYTFVRYAPEWVNLPGLFRTGLQDSLSAAGFAAPQIERYLHQAGTAQLTRTHGRRAVAFLNRAWDDVLLCDLCLDPAGEAQPLIDHAVNTRPGRCAGSSEIGTGLARITALLASL